MKYSRQDMEKMHRTLYSLCGLAQVPLTVQDEFRWAQFLHDLVSLEETEGGAFTHSDLVAVLSYMSEQKRKGVPFSMRPTSIMRDSERMRDMVLESRRALAIKKRRSDRPRPEPVLQQLPDGTQRLTDDRTTDPDAVAIGAEAAQAFADLRKQAGL